jgi:anthranilate synthase component I
MTFPSKEEFLAATGGVRPMPVCRDLLADMETPLSAYWKLAHDEPCSFLLESVTGGEQLARYSILGVRPRTVLRSKGRKARKIGRNGEQRIELREGQDPLDLLKEELAGLSGSDERRTTNDDDRDAHSLNRGGGVQGLPKFWGGAVGMLSYDLVRFLERLPDGQQDDLELDDMAMMLADKLVVFDHAKNLAKIIVLASGTPESYDEACAEIERIATRLKRPLPELPNAKSEGHELTCNQTQEEFQAAAGRAIEYIGAGDCIQVVLSQRLETRLDSHPLSVYRALRSLNPSPYMFLLRFGDFDLVGASPEILVSLEDREARVRPIAGTRWRGKTPQEDEVLAQELLADEKERAEHIMLVDLGRNDLGRVCDYGSVMVNELMVVERYSHVMHIVSDVTGRLRPESDAFDLIRASFPAGTVSGAPKVRAMEIIEELEPTRRGPYAGSVGYIGANGDMDLCITIRTILIKDHRAYIQAGAGIVWDSVPEKEFEECRNKARAALRALEIAGEGLTNTE